MIARPRRPPTTPSSRARSTRGCVRSNGDRRRCAHGDIEAPDEEPRPPLRRRVRRRSSHRGRNRSGGQAREHPEHGRIAGADPAAAVHRVPQPVAGRRRIAAVGAVAASSCSARSGSPARQLSAAATGAAAMLFGLGVDGVVLLYVAHIAGAWRRDADADVPAAIAGPSSSMLLGMWTTAATFYGLTFVDFPSLQQLGRLIGHSMVVCGILTLVLVPALLPRRPPRRAAPALPMPRLADWIVRRRRPVLAAAVVLTCVLGVAATRLRINPTLDRLRSVTDAAQLEDEDRRRVRPAGRRLRRAGGGASARAAARDERAPRAPARRRGPGRRRAAADPAAAVRGVAGADGGAGSARRRLSPAGVRAALEARARGRRLHAGRVRSVFGAAAAPARSGRAPHLRRLRGPWPRRPGRSLRRRATAHRWTLATYVFPSDADQALAGAEDRRRGRSVADASPACRSSTASWRAASCPQFVKGLAIGTLIVVALVVAAFRSWRLSLFALLPTVIGLVWAAGAAGAGRRRAGSVRALRGRHLRRHRRRLRHPPRAPLSGARRRRARDRRARAGHPRGRRDHACSATAR